MLIILRANQEVVATPTALGGHVHVGDVRTNRAGASEQFVTQRAGVPAAPMAVHVVGQAALAEVATPTNVAVEGELVTMVTNEIACHEGIYLS